MTRVALVLGLAAAAVGCKAPNPLSCELPDNADEPACQPPPDAAEVCPTECVARQFCHDQVCVDCVVSAQCEAPDAPVCRADHTCGPCTAHGDCASNVCDLPSGRCVDEQDVIYVEAGATGTDCARSTPCPTLAAGALQLGARRVIKLEGTDVIGDPATTTLDDADATIFADPGTAISSTAAVALAITGDARVAIFDLRIHGAAGDAIVLGGTATLALDHVGVFDNVGRGVVVDGGALAIHGGVIALNRKGGLELENATMEVTNTLFVANGDPASAVGGVKADPLGVPVFDFNTIANNQIAATNLTRGGVNCVSDFIAHGNIVTGNQALTCLMFDHSLFDAGLLPPAGGPSNVTGDPRFKNVDPADPMATTFYRIFATSDARDGAADVGDVTIDIDGDPRPTAMKDIGADEAN